MGNEDRRGGKKNKVQHQKLTSRSFRQKVREMFGGAAVKRRTQTRMIVISSGCCTLTDAGAVPDSSSTVTKIPIHKQDLLTDGGDCPPPSAVCVCALHGLCVGKRGERDS